VAAGITGPLHHCAARRRSVDPNAAAGPFLLRPRRRHRRDLGV